MFWWTPAALNVAAAIMGTAGLVLWMRERRRVARLRLAHAAAAAAAAALERAVQQPIVTVDPDGLIRAYNRAAEALFGYSGEELLGQNLARLLLPGEAAKEEARARGAEFYELPGEARRKDGGVIPVWLRVVPLSSEHPPRVRFFIEDRSRQQRQAQLELENQLLWPTFDEAGLVIALVNCNGQIIRLSGAGVNLLGLSDAEVEGRLYWEVFHKPEEWDSARDAFDQAKTKLGPSRLQAEWVAGSGRPAALDWLMLSPAWDSKGELAHVVVTAALASHGSLVSQQEMHRAMERVAGRIAGHFENLLSTVNGYSELVLHDLSPASPLRKEVEHILAASSRASDIVRQLLGFSGHRLRPPERVDLNALLHRTGAQGHGDAIVVANRRDMQEMLSVIRGYAASRSLNGAPGRLTTEPVCLRQAHATIIAELPPGSYVKLCAPLYGIDETELLQHLLEPFASPIRGMPDTAGVGLAVVSGIARSCGGGVSLSRAPEGGVVLEVWLPALAAQDAAEDDSAEPRRTSAAAHGAGAP